MDQEVTKTLGELERKLQELERTLAAIDLGEQQVEQSPAPTAPTPSPSPPHLIDEAAKRVAPIKPTPQPSGASTPRTDELLRFRDRLERTASELTREYDELLGRLSFPPCQLKP